MYVLPLACCLSGSLRDQDVTVKTLDSFNLRHADVIKIDVEGHASHVLAGAEKTLQRHRPILWFEHSEETAPEVHFCLHSYPLQGSRLTLAIGIAHKGEWANESCHPRNDMEPNANEGRLGSTGT